METTTCNHKGFGTTHKGDSVTCGGCKATWTQDPEAVDYFIRDGNLDPMGGGDDYDEVRAYYDGLVETRGRDSYGEAPFGMWRRVGGLFGKSTMIAFNGRKV